MTGDVGPAKSVLVVEDQFLTAESLAEMLGELGYRVVGPVPRASEARRIVDTEPPDAALLDVNLRGELVTPVAERLVELGLPFAFLTAHPGLEMLPAVYRSFPVLTKPCSIEELDAAPRTLV